MCSVEGGTVGRTVEGIFCVDDSPGWESGKWSEWKAEGAAWPIAHVATATSSNNQGV